MRQSLNELLLRMEIYYFVDVRFLKHLLVVIKSVPLPKKEIKNSHIKLLARYPTSPRR